MWEYANTSVAYDAYGTESEREGEREREREELVTFLGQLPGQMWEYAHTSVAFDASGIHMT